MYPSSERASACQSFDQYPTTSILSSPVQCTATLSRDFARRDAAGKWVGGGGRDAE